MTKKSMDKLNKMLGRGPKVTIDGKVYMQEDLSPACINLLNALTEAQNRAAKAQQDQLLAQAAVVMLQQEVKNLLPGSPQRNDAPSGEKAPG